MRIVALNGEIPPTPKDESEREFYKERGIITLDDEYEQFLGYLFFKVVEAGQYNMRLNSIILEKYCQKESLDFIETYEILKSMLSALNKALADKVKK